MSQSIALQVVFPSPFGSSIMLVSVHFFWLILSDANGIFISANNRDVVKNLILVQKAQIHVFHLIFSSFPLPSFLSVGIGSYIILNVEPVQNESLIYLLSIEVIGAIPEVVVGMRSLPTHETLLTGCEEQEADWQVFLKKWAPMLVSQSTQLVMRTQLYIQSRSLLLGKHMDTCERLDHYHPTERTFSPKTPLWLSLVVVAIQKHWTGEKPIRIEAVPSAYVETLLEPPSEPCTVVLFFSI